MSVCMNLWKFLCVSRSELSFTHTRMYIRTQKGIYRTHWLCLQCCVHSQRKAGYWIVGWVCVHIETVSYYRVCDCCLSVFVCVWLLSLCVRMCVFVCVCVCVCSTCRVWNYKKQKCVAEFSGHKYAVMVCTLPSGQIITGNNNISSISLLLLLVCMMFDVWCALHFCSYLLTHTHTHIGSGNKDIHIHTLKTPKTQQITTKVIKKAHNRMCLRCVCVCMRDGERERGRFRLNLFYFVDNVLIIICIRCTCVLFVYVFVCVCVRVPVCVLQII